MIKEKINILKIIKKKKMKNKILQNATKILVAVFITSITLTGCAKTEKSATNDSNTTENANKTCVISDSIVKKESAKNDTQTSEKESVSNSQIIEMLKKNVEELKEKNKQIGFVEIGKKQNNTLSKEIKNCKNIVNIDTTKTEIIKSEANENPEKNFFTLGGKKDNSIKNLYEIKIDYEKTGKLLGYLASAMTRTGFIGVFTDEKTNQSSGYIKGVEKGISQYNAQNGTAIKTIKKNISTKQDEKIENKKSKIKANTKKSNSTNSKTNMNKDKTESNNSNASQISQTNQINEIQKTTDKLLKSKADIIIPFLEKGTEQMLPVFKQYPKTNIISLELNLDKIDPEYKKIVLANVQISLKPTLEKIVKNTEKNSAKIANLNKIKLNINYDDKGIIINIPEENKKNIPGYVLKMIQSNMK